MKSVAATPGSVPEESTKSRWAPAASLMTTWSAWPSARLAPTVNRPPSPARLSTVRVRKAAAFPCLPVVRSTVASPSRVREERVESSVMFHAAPPVKARSMLLSVPCSSVWPLKKELAVLKLTDTAAPPREESLAMISPPIRVTKLLSASVSLTRNSPPVTCMESYISTVPLLMFVVESSFPCILFMETLFFIELIMFRVSYSVNVSYTFMFVLVASILYVSNPSTDTGLSHPDILSASRLESLSVSEAKLTISPATTDEPSTVMEVCPVQELPLYMSPLMVPAFREEELTCIWLNVSMVPIVPSYPVMSSRKSREAEACSLPV